MGNASTVCEFQAPELVEVAPDTYISSINPSLCKGCGTCASLCPSGAIISKHFTDTQVHAMIDAFFGEEVKSMTPTKKGEASANPRKGSTAATNKKVAGGKRKPRTTGKTSTAAAKPNASSKPVAKKTAAKPAAEQAAAKPPAAKTVAKEKPAWEPQIIVFACNWCSYAGADTAGVSRIQHQPNFRMIRVMCSGRIQPAFVLRAFEKGADGVLVSGCHFGDCHYIFGNERAAEQFEKTKDMVRLLGIEEGRLRLEWISAAEGARFAQVINEFTDQVRDLGPIPFSKSQPIEQTEDVA